MERQGQAIGVALVVISTVGFAWIPTLARLAYDAGANVPTVLTVRFGGVVLLAWPLLLLRRQAALPPGRWLGLVASGLLFATNTSTFFFAVRYAPASTVALIFYSYPALVALFSTLWLRERFTLVRGIALALAMFGCLLTLGFDLSGADIRGIGLAFISATFYAGYIVLSSRAVQGIPVVLASTWIMTGMALVFLGFSLGTGTLDFSFEPRGWLILGMLVLAGTVLAVYAFLAGVMRLGPSRAAILGTLEPVLAVIVAALVLGEQITPMRIAGGVAILAAVLLLRVPTADSARQPVLESRDGSAS